MPVPPWSPADVLAAAAEWIYLPDTARVERHPGLVVVAYPETFEQPTLAVVLDSDRTCADLLHRAAAAAAALGRDALVWVVGDTTRPADLEPELRRRGAEVVEEVDVLAVRLDEPLPRLDVPRGLEVRVAADRHTVRDALTVAREAFGGPAVDEAQVDHALAELAAEPGRYGRVVAYRAGTPVGSGGWTVADGGVLRLWGAGTTVSARGTGAYRAVLDARLRQGVDRGCTIALATARVDTSSPILRRNGFRRYGSRRHLRLAAGT